MYSKVSYLLSLLLITLLLSCNKEEDKADDPDPIEPTQWFIDFDEDGFGNSDINAGKLAIEQPLGFTKDNSDCDDNDMTINPNAEEDPYDGIDSDCNNEQEQVINSLSLNFGDVSTDYAVGVTETSDGGFVTGGSSYSDEVVNFRGNFTFYLVKTDNEGVVKWEKRYGGPDEDTINDMKATSDGGFILCGASKSAEGNVRINFGDFDWWVVKIDSEGNIVWEMTLGGSEREIPNSIIETKDGGYLVGGKSRSSDEYVGSNYGGNDAWLVKLDALGNVIWENNYGGFLGDEINVMLQLESGDFILSADTSSIDGDLINRTTTGGSLWVLRLNELGDILWQKTFQGGNEHGIVNDLTLSLSGDILFTGTILTSSENSDGWIMSMTENGIVNWTKTYGGISYDSFVSMDINNEGGYYVTGDYSPIDRSVLGERAIWLVKLDDSGNLIWENTYGGTGTDKSASVKAIDEGILIAGQSYSTNGDIKNNIGSQDILFLKLKPNGKL